MKCAARDSTSVAAWKLLGDVLLQHNAVTPALGHPLLKLADKTGAAREAPPQVLEQDWKRRLEALRLARRAYSRVLHVDPVQPGGWHDVAAAAYHEAQLRRQHASSSSGVLGGSAEELSRVAERAVRSGLALQSSGQELWTSLGIVADQVCLRHLWPA